MLGGETNVTVEWRGAHDLILTSDKTDPQTRIVLTFQFD